MKLADKFRQWNETRKKNNEDVKTRGKKAVEDLIKKYAPHVKEKKRGELANKFSKNLFAYHDEASYWLAAEHPVNHAITAAMIALPAAGAIINPLNLALAPAYLLLKSARLSRGYELTNGSTSPLGRTCVNVNNPIGELLGRDTLKHEAVHYIMRNTVGKRPMALEEGLANYAAMVRTKKYAIGLPKLNSYTLKCLWGWKPKGVKRFLNDGLKLNSPDASLAGDYMHEIGERLEDLAGRDVHDDLLRELFKGKHLGQAVRAVGKKRGIKKKKVREFIREHSPL